VRQLLVKSIERMRSEYVSKVLNEKLEPMSEKDISEILEDETDTKQ
jgi:hypothetical protein